MRVGERGAFGSEFGTDVPPGLRANGLQPARTGLHSEPQAAPPARRGTISIWGAVLPFVLSLVAGSVDAISFLGLGGLFAAHITGNLVILSAHIVSGNAAPMAQILAVPVFMVALLLTRLFASRLDEAGRGTLGPLLLLQFLLIAGVLAVAVEGRINGSNTNTILGILAGMLGVSAMAVQNALVQISLVHAPSTAVMTTNITRFTVDAGQVLFGRDPKAAAEARIRAGQTWPAIVGFAVGCGAGAAAQAAFGLLALTLPTGLALLALGLGGLSQLRA